jgi:Tripartite tricarboxylate transporter family receptor
MRLSLTRSATERRCTTRFQFVPYRGGGPAVQDLVAGQLDIMFESPTNTRPQVHSGQLKAFAVAGESRLAAAPEIPTVDEAGLPGFYVPFWVGLWAPKGTPKEVVAKLNSAAVTALADPTVSTLVTDLGFEIYSATSRRPRRLPPIRRPKSRNGFRSLRSSGSRWSEQRLRLRVTNGCAGRSPDTSEVPQLTKRPTLCTAQVGRGGPGRDIAVRILCNGHRRSCGQGKFVERPSGWRQATYLGEFPN